MQSNSVAALGWGDLSRALLFTLPLPFLFFLLITPDSPYFLAPGMFYVLLGLMFKN